MAVLTYYNRQLEGTVNVKPLVNSLQKDFPQFTLLKGETFYWSSRTKEIFYREEGDISSLLHELGHAILGHRRFQTDVELLGKEVAAWEKARETAAAYGITLDEQVAERSLDSYRDWLYTRSSCPTCNNHGIQRTQKLYGCINCGDTWNVSASVLCRVYRQSTGRSAKSSSGSTVQAYIKETL